MVGSERKYAQSYFESQFILFSRTSLICGATWPCFPNQKTPKSLLITTETHWINITWLHYTKMNPLPLARISFTHGTNNTTEMTHNRSFLLPVLSPQIILCLVVSYAPVFATSGYCLWAMPSMARSTTSSSKNWKGRQSLSRCCQKCSLGAGVSFFDSAALQVYIHPPRASLILSIIGPKWNWPSYWYYTLLLDILPL